MHSQSRCPLENPPPVDWTLCHALALGAALPIFLVVLPFRPGKPIGLFT